MTKKRLVQINTVCNGSTGGIMKEIQKEAEQQGYKTLSIYGRRKGYESLPSHKFGSGLSFWIHVFIATFFDRQGWGSYFHTKKMVNELRIFKPDVIHLHNLHGYYLHLPTIMKYLVNEYQGKIFWTFHDCWPITGHCPYFIMAKCDKWKKECQKCPNKNSYPISWGLDNSKKNYEWKKKFFLALKDLTIICPSLWMKQIIDESFLKNRKSIIVSNGINQSIFYPRDGKDTLMKYHIPLNKKILLGVASIWEERKGLEDFLKLAEVISDEYIIVLIGVNKFQNRHMPNNIIGICRTEDQNELAQLYSEAYLFINPSREESFSLVTIEAMACGTPVIALGLSATKELVNEKNGYLLNDSHIETYLWALDICKKRRFSREEIRNSVQKYTIENMSRKIIEMYE